jgi:hypothetical protein
MEEYLESTEHFSHSTENDTTQEYVCKNLDGRYNFPGAGPFSRFSHISVLQAIFYWPFRSLVI